MKIGYAKTIDEFKKLKPLTDKLFYNAHIRDVLPTLEKGDVLVVCDMASLGYRTKWLFDFVKSLNELGISVYSLDDVIDTRKPEHKELFDKFQVFLDIDRRVIGSKIKDRKAFSSVTPGRPRLLNDEQEERLLEMRDAGKATAGEISRMFGISKSAYYRIISTKKIT